MSRNSNLVPTTVVDKNGRTTTVHRKPVDGSKTASKAIPAPTTQKSGLKQRKELERSVIDIFPKGYGKFTDDSIYVIRDESLKIIRECATRIIERPRSNSDLRTFSAMISETRIMNYPDSVYPFLLRGIENMGDELAVANLLTIYKMGLSTDRSPAPDDVLDAHVQAASKYFMMALKADYDDISYSYTSNQPLFDFVAKHPDKVDIIMQHYLTYYPEKNGYDDFERDIDELGDLSKPMGAGWL